MKSRDFSSWIWGDALALLHHAERLQRQVLRSTHPKAHAWEPPVDIVESTDAVQVIVALPGVRPDDVVVRFDPQGITVTGLRPVPAAHNTRIHQLEIPYGQFLRRINLPLHALEPGTPQLANGCLLLTLNKLREIP
ncbi:Hsp20/alpha crystallin family protein [Bordetella avium]|uniref:Heat shock protein n=1 Tax=Bordetella avium (strain 197N) TaxID=360910 RepID=Q2KYH5_BORA1|nr:Hsp20/alpha crystallin family protein [Bordetella avium]AZY52979.1 Hsp20/alpha crystallin family protein [Bordetella avium]RIQ11975.1 Hsp20/alpha crystallin family protein [Bordetella avium]RIQ17717.1 Hsp20/alpha crystallin family protein [Bordetella avium]RIQ32374.1 Hsp20/alpha crystallin family protein [Bordetella avium]RIQ37075.1 Hsp20/alpha crystallin family protein [Bordetella avium]